MDQLRSTSGLTITEIQIPALERIHNDLLDTEDSLRHALSRLLGLYDRMQGQLPTGNFSAYEPKTSCLISRLDASVNSLRCISDALHALATEFERVA